MCFAIWWAKTGAPRVTVDVSHMLILDLQFPREVFDSVYDKFNGHAWYMQNVLNRLYGYNRDVETGAGVVCCGTDCRRTELFV